MAQGKCRPRFDLGDRNVGDGLGGSQLCGKPRWGDSTLECHCVEMSAPVDGKGPERARPRFYLQHARSGASEPLVRATAVGRNHGLATARGRTIPGGI
jgi:hypothetical protein